MGNARPSKKAAGMKLGPRPATADHLVSAKKALVVRHEVVLDNELADALVAARQEYELAEARFKAKPSDEAVRSAFEVAEQSYRDAQAAAAEVVFEVVLRGIGRHRFDLLKRRHPPTDEDCKNAEALGLDPRRLEFSPTSFPPAIIAASLVEPVMTEDEVRDGIWESDNWNAAEAESLYLAAMRANQVRSSVDLGKAFGGTPASGLSSPSATGTASPAASS